MTGIALSNGRFGKTSHFASVFDQTADNLDLARKLNISVEA
jgi:hypothetical protein